MDYLRRPSLLVFLLLCSWNPRLDAGQEVKRYALLVGCTVYPASDRMRSRELYGPAHDVALWSSFLETHGFPRENVTTLVGWPDDPRSRPTLANIAAGWEKLIARSDGDTQIFILMSGHGSQLPIPESQDDPLDSRNPEPDGQDEVFLPADLEDLDERPWIKNHILDDQFGLWLDQFRARGASVWVVFDCCHSGTMDRGADDFERSREVLPQQLGIPGPVIARASERARKAVEAAEDRGERSRGLGALEPSALALPTEGAARGGVVAFYAAQAFETAPELPRPRNAPHTKEHYYGLLSYTLIKTLGERGSAMSYRQLSQILIGEYAAERGSGRPTPYCEGDLDREVFGLRTWPRGGDFVLQRREDALVLNAGELRGLTPGSILSVHSPAGTNHDPNAIQGYVRVTALTPVSANVVPCAGPDGKQPEADPSRFEERARCRLVTRDFGTMKLRIAIRSANPDASGGEGQVREAFDRMAPEVKALVDLIPDEADASYVLWVEGGRLFLKDGSGHATYPKESAAETQRTTDRSPPRRVFGNYKTDDPDRLARRLERDLQSVFTWRNLWRIGGTIGNKTDDASDIGLQLEFQKLNANREPDGELVNGHPVVAGQRVRYRLKNKGFDDLWVSLVWLDGDFGIETEALSLKGHSETRWRGGTIKGDTTGKEGLIVLAVPMKRYREQPDFTFLNQPRLQSQELDGLRERMRGAPDLASQTPFQQLMRAAAFGQGTRSFQADEPTNPAILTWSWIALPPAS